MLTPRLRRKVGRNYDRPYVVVEQGISFLTWTDEKEYIKFTFILLSNAVQESLFTRTVQMSYHTSLRSCDKLHLFESLT
ncbi:MAG: hypothetical protein ACI9BF_000454 [Candidatus Paceibacteria bacterium]|jgi:hypothetical protein